MNIDLKRYADLKARRLMRVELLGPDTFQVLKRRFDPESSVELKPDVLVCDQKGVRAQIEQMDQIIAGRQAEIDTLVAQKAGLQALLEEMRAAEAAAQKP